MCGICYTFASTVVMSCMFEIHFDSIAAPTKTKKTIMFLMLPGSCVKKAEKSKMVQLSQLQDLINNYTSACAQRQNPLT